MTSSWPTGTVRNKFWTKEISRYSSQVFISDWYLKLQQPKGNIFESAASVKSTTMASWWARWRLKSLASRLFTQTFFQAQIKQNIKAPLHWPLCGNSPHKGSVTRKMFSFYDVIMHFDQTNILSAERFHEISTVILDDVIWSLKNLTRSLWKVETTWKKDIQDCGQHCPCWRSNAIGWSAICSCNAVQFRVLDRHGAGTWGLNMHLLVSESTIIGPILLVLPRWVYLSPSYLRNG